jgi:hypothetical protein
LPRKIPGSRPFAASAAEPSSALRFTAHPAHYAGRTQAARRIPPVAALGPGRAGLIPGRAGAYEPAAYLACRAGRTLGDERDHLLAASLAFNSGGFLVFSGIINGAFNGYRPGRRGAFRFPDGGCFCRGGIPGIPVPGGDYDLGLRLFYRLLRRSGGRRNGFLLYLDHLFDRVWERNRFFPLGFLIVFLPLNEFYLGFLGVI